MCGCAKFRLSRCYVVERANIGAMLGSVVLGTASFFGVIAG